MAEGDASLRRPTLATLLALRAEAALEDPTTEAEEAAELAAAITGVLRVTDEGAKPEDRTSGQPEAGAATGQAAAAGGAEVAGGLDVPDGPRSSGRRRRWDSLRSEALFHLALPAAALVVLCRRLRAPGLARRLQILS